MFVCEKVARGHRYLYLVESVREGKRVRQRTIRALGRKDVLHASGELDRLIASLARHSERAMVLSDIEAGRLACVRIGGPLLFGRLWEQLGLGEVVNDLLDGRGFEFALERAVFVSVLHRLFVSGSDRSCEKWMGDYAIPGIDGLKLHHLYRTMAWLGEELDPAAEGDLAPRCVKDEIEERLFARRRDLFTDLSLVFMDTTTLSFHGAGGESLGAHGHSKDHRPDLRQMVLAVVLDGEGRPVCTEMLAGNTADMTVLLPVVDRLRKRFGIGRVCVVADRGMISAATIAALEERGLDYILGARERGTAVIREVVLKREKPFTPLLIERGRGDTQLFVKQVTVGGARYIVCRNEAEAEKDRADRQAIVAGLEKRLASGDKALIGNSAYRRYLRKRGTGAAFEIDLGKLADEARFDGIFVLRTNATMTPLNAVLRYRELLQVEDLFRRAKTQLRTRPIYHSCDAAIRGHVFCSFLALVLQKELADRCRAADVTVEWDDLIRDLDRLQEATIEKDGKRVTTRTHVEGRGTAAPRCRDRRAGRPAADPGTPRGRPVRCARLLRFQPRRRCAAALDAAAQGQPRGARRRAGRVPALGVGRRAQAQGAGAAASGGGGTLYALVLLVSVHVFIFRNGSNLRCNISGCSAIHLDGFGMLLNDLISIRRRRRSEIHSDCTPLGSAPPTTGCGCRRAGSGRPQNRRRMRGSRDPALRREDGTGDRSR